MQYSWNPNGITVLIRLGGTVCSDICIFCSRPCLGTCNVLIKRILLWLSNGVCGVIRGQKLTEIDWGDWGGSLLGGDGCCNDYIFLLAEVYGVRKRPFERYFQGASIGCSIVENDGELGDSDLNYWWT